MTKSNQLTAMTISLPSKLKAWVKAKAKSTGCATPSEYIRRILHQAQRADEQERLERKLVEGLASPGREMTRKEWEKLRQGTADRETQHVSLSIPSAKR